jgi:hypothetical protein
MLCGVLREDPRPAELRFYGSGYAGQHYALFLFFRSPVEHCLYRRAYRLILAMNTTQPATRPAHPFLEFTDRPFNMLPSRLVFFDEGNPTDPLIARKGCQILPYC